jgi:hypothetical protein
MERMREMVQQSTSSSTGLATTAEQMSNLSRALLESMGRFVIDETEADGRRYLPPKETQPEAARRAPREYAEVGRS